MRQDNRIVEAMIIAFLMALVLLWAHNAWSAEIVPDDIAIRAIIGEASGEGLKGMQAVGEVIRRRGSLKGVYGFKAPHVDKEPEWVWKMARKAWKDSEFSNLSNGATHFESTDFKNAYWMEDMECVAHIGKHRFYLTKFK